MKLKLLTASSILLLTACGGADNGEAENAITASDASVSMADNSEKSPIQEQTAQIEPALCLSSGPQTPRDISRIDGMNASLFDLAPASTELNLCNIHTHTNAEHKGPGFTVFVNDSDRGGYACNETSELSGSDLAPAPGAYGGVVPGETIEVHWVFTSCDATPGEGLGSCVPENCENPQLRVEAQTFLVVNDPEAQDFMKMVYAANVVNDRHQPLMLPTGTGEPVVFHGSTTGPSYTMSKCSPFQVTWSVRPQCTRLDINSLHAWAESGNVFNETESHGVRQLVTAPELLAPIK